jgi:hypothetical protein
MEAPRPAKMAKVSERDTAPRLYVVLEMSPLETIKVFCVFFRFCVCEVGSHVHSNRSVASTVC